MSSAVFFACCACAVLAGMLLAERLSERNRSDESCRDRYSELLATTRRGTPDQWAACDAALERTDALLRELEWRLEACWLEAINGSARSST